MVKPNDLKPLMIFRNTWWSGLKDGYVILLSADTERKNEGLKGEYLWTIAFSYKGCGCSIRKWYSEEILQCKFLGYLPDLLTKRG